MALRAVTPAPPMAPAVNRATTSEVFFKAADFMERFLQWEARSGAGTHNYEDAVLGGA
jgi:hypothetical protein